MTASTVGIYETIAYEQRKYKSKGFGNFFAMLLTFAFFYYAPEVGKVFWANVLTIDMDIRFLVPLVTFLQAIFVHLTLNSIIGIIYCLEWPFFEKYKISK